MAFYFTPEWWLVFIGLFLMSLGIPYQTSVRYGYSRSERGLAYLRTMPALVWAGAFGAVITIFPSLVNNLSVVGLAGAASAIVGLYLPRSLSDTLDENQLRRVGMIMTVIGLIPFTLAIFLPLFLCMAVHWPFITNNQAGAGDQAVPCSAGHQLGKIGVMRCAKFDCHENNQDCEQEQAEA